MITALVSKKGGVGKTTTAVNLAAALASRGHRVLLVDLDPNAGTSLSLGLSRRQLGWGSAGLLLSGIPSGEVLRHTGVPGLDIIPASVDLRSAEVELAARGDKEHALARALDGLDGRYDYIFLDCPSSVGLLTRNALAACDGYMIPAVPHFLALEGLERLVENVRRLRFRCASRSRFLGVLLTMADYRTALTRQNVQAIRGRFGDQAFAVEIRVNIRLAEAPSHGQTIFEHSPGAVGALCYELLADELLWRYGRLVRREAEDGVPAPVATVAASA